MGWVGAHGTYRETGEVYECTGFWRGDLRKRDHLNDIGIDGRIILKRIFKKWNGGTWA